MSYSIFPTPLFEKQLKRLVKKYPSLKTEYLQLIKNIHYNPFQGNAIGQSCYKIRLSIASKGKGKSGGARVITNIVINDSIVYLLSIYDKSEQDSISFAELDTLLKQIPE
jgi:mRNA-degrading endonuclease RelE of RelBE toxin-antitoxin system